MAIFLSPGVYSKETDLSQIINGVGSSVSSIVLQSKKGLVMERTFISSVQSMLHEFGEPDIAYGWGVYAALAFLNEGKQLWVTRVAPQSIHATLLVAAPQVVIPFIIQVTIPTDGDVFRLGVTENKIANGGLGGPKLG